MQCSLTHLELLVQCCRTAGLEDTQGIHLSVEADPHLVHTYSINTLSQQKCPHEIPSRLMQTGAKPQA